MQGLYYPNGSFKSVEEIRKEAILTTGLQEPDFRTPITDITKPYSYWSQRARTRQAQYKETAERDYCVEIGLPDTCLINFMADLHIGGAETDYKRIEDEIQIIVNTHNSFLMIPGDLIDAFFFNPAQYEDIEQIQEQIEYAKALVKYVADHKKLLAVWTGNHDMWVKKAGFDPMRYILEGIETYYFHGVGYVKTTIADQESYNITGNHLFKGSSVYNNSHPQRRAINEVAHGSDIVVSGHWHTKGISQQPFQSFGGESQIATMIALGTYKASDEYTRTYGFGVRDPKSMYGATVRIERDFHTVTPYYDILEAHRRFI
jgi:predicted phosphodiesterase